MFKKTASRALSYSSLFSHTAEETAVPPLVLHCRFTKNNTMYTLSRRVHQTFKNSPASPEEDSLAVDQAKLIDQIRPRQQVVLHMTAGEAGFSGKRQRAPEAAFAATSRLFEKMQEKGVLNQPIEIVFKDFGPTRKVFLNALFGREGAKVRPFVKRLTDLTPIRFGGDRPPNRQRK